MAHCRRTRAHRHGHRLFWVVGLSSLAWLLLRSGSNPRRLAYPCQRAAAASALGFLGYLAGLVGVAQLYRLTRDRFAATRALPLALALLLVVGLTGSYAPTRPAGAVATVDLPSWTSPTAVSNVYAVNDVPVPECSLEGGALPTSPPCNDPSYAFADGGVDSLLAEMAAHGEPFHRTAASPQGLVGSDDVVVVKVNNQWGHNGHDDGQGRLATNTDVLKGVVWALLQHPDGFAGEVVVAENIQWSGSSWEVTPANAEHRGQSLHDVVTAFASRGYPVSLATWDDLPLVPGGSVNASGYPSGEYARGSDADAYILLEDPQGSGSDELSYPKFTTAQGARVSMRYGVWDGGAYDADRLTLINLPVLKAHGMAGATVAWKNLIGFVTIGDTDRRYGDWDRMHDYYWGYTGTADSDYGLLGRQLALVRSPDLNIVDAIWVADDNYDGNAVRQDVLLASTDPFAVDWYASEYVLLPSMSWFEPNVSAARAGTFRSATRTNQNAAASVWPGGSYPWVDLLDGYDGDDPSDSERLQMNVYVAGGGSACSLTCDATVPTQAVPGEPAPFVATASAVGCSGSPAFVWDFGDGEGGSGQSLTHPYEFGGRSYDWTLTVTVDDQTCTDSGSIAVGGGPPPFFDLLIPAVIHSPGAEGTQWRTALVCLNPGGEPLQLSLTLVTDSSATQRTVDLNPGATVEWTDVVVELFEASGDASTAGAVHLAASGQVLATSRTYNETPLGTYGQYLPALTRADGIDAEHTGYLLQAKRNDSFRTNIGFANLGDGEVEVVVRLFDEGGSRVGAERRVTVPPGRWRQENDIFNLAGAGTVDLGYATVELAAGAGPVWAYASVVDRATGDATTIPLLTP